MSMARRLLAGCLACGLAGGCAVLPTWAPSASTSEKPAAQASGDAKELPSAQTAKIQMALAEEMVKKGDRAGAIAQYEKARANDASLDGRVSHRLGVLYDQLDQRARSLEEFQRALKSPPRDSALHSALLSDVGYCYYNRGEWTEAEKYLRQALQLDAGNPRAHNTLGMTLAQEGKSTEALQEFGKVVSPAKAQANLGFILLVQGKRDEARQAYRRALELEPHLDLAQAALEKLDAPTPIVTPPAPSQTGEATSPAAFLPKAIP